MDSEADSGFATGGPVHELQCLPRAKHSRYASVSSMIFGMQNTVGASAIESQTWMLGVDHGAISIIFGVKAMGTLCTQEEYFRLAQSDIDD